MNIIQIGGTYVNFDNLVEFRVVCTSDFREYFFKGVSTGGANVRVSISKGEADDLLNRISSMVDYRVDEEHEPTPTIPPVFDPDCIF